MLHRLSVPRVPAAGAFGRVVKLCFSIPLCTSAVVISYLIDEISWKSHKLVIFYVRSRLFSGVMYFRREIPK